MTNHDESAANEQLAHAELTTVMRQLRAGSLDIVRPIRTPSQDRGKDTVAVNFRYAKYLDAAVSEHYGKGKKFAHRSEFIRHYMVVGLAIENLLENEPVLDAATIKAAQDDERDQLATIQAAYDSIDDSLRHGASVKVRQRMLIRLRDLLPICEEYGFDIEAAHIRNTIDNQTRFIADAINLDRQPES